MDGKGEFSTSFFTPANQRASFKHYFENFSKIESIWPGTGWKNLLKKVVTGQLFWGPVMIFVFFSYNEREYDRKYRFYYFK